MKKQVDEFQKVCEALVQLSRFIASRKLDEALFYLRRLAFSNRQSDAMVWLELNKLVSEEAINRDCRAIGAIERESRKVLSPQDNDSNLDLITVQHPPIQMKVMPIYSERVSKELTTIVMEYGKRKILEHMGLLASAKLIFSGPPGVGKTLSAEWISNQVGIPLCTLNLAAVMSSYLGKTGNNIRQVFEFASKTPCVLLLDEFDAIAKKRDDQSDVGELKRLVTVLLQEIDNFSSESILIAATNHPDLLDPAVWRRFDHRIHFDLPEAAGVRTAVRQNFADDFAMISEYESLLCSALSGKSYSEIRRVVIAIRRDAVVRGVSIRDSVLGWFASDCADMSKQDRKTIAVLLSEKGYGQREVNRLTGVSRDTIRTAMRKKGGK